MVKIARPVPIRNKNKLPLPAVPAALGMAVSFYSYPLLLSIPRGLYLLAGLIFVLLIAVTLLRVLRFLPWKTTQAVPIIGLLAVAAAAGFVLGIAARRAAPGPAKTGLAPETVIAVRGLLREDPRTLQGGSGLGILELRECSGPGGLRATAGGSITVFFPAESIPRLKEFGRGCEIYSDGIYTAGSNSAGDQRPVFRAASVHITKPASSLEQFRTGLRQKLLDRFQSRRGEIPVWGSFASALLLGIRDDLDTDFSGAFRNSGCTHILALSGMHLAIISGVLAFFLKKPLGIRWASLIGALFIVFYVFVAGSQPSLVRAAIMYLIGTLALWNLLKGKTISLLSMAFIIQLIFQGETGTSLSFILSYLALAGMVSLGEPLQSLFRGRLPNVIGGGISASLGAFIATAPVVVFYFGSLWPIGILAGLVVAPVSSLFMVIALAALAASFIPIPLWDLLDLVLSLIYRFIEVTVSAAGRVPGFSFPDAVPVLFISILTWLLILFLRKLDDSKRKSLASFD